MSDFCVLTCYFNPCGYATKKENFDRYARGVKAVGASLLVVEMAIGDTPFELGDGHDVIRVRGDGVMWQKERLLNLAAARLPSEVTKVAWIDGDVLFEHPRWLEMASAALEHVAVIQPFDTCIRLPRGHLSFVGEVQADETTTESFAAAFLRDPSLARRGTFRTHGHTGFGWAARRELFDACGLYDACLTGSGDHLMAHVFAGALDSECIPAMLGSGSYIDHFRRWAARAHEVVQGRLGCVEGRLLHLWHGEKSDRRYYLHNQHFQTFGFDPDRHIRVGADGLLEWADAPEAVRDWSRTFFASRNEDGVRPPRDA